MKIVILDSYSFGNTDLSPITSLGECTIHDNSTQEQVVDRCQSADVVVTNKVKIFREQMDALPDLRLICVAATGTNNVDLEYAEIKGITVLNVPAYSTQSVTEATVSMVLALLRNTLYYDNYVKSGLYAASGRCFNVDMPISQISGKRWGVIGMGNIGKSVAGMASAFGAKVCYYSTSGMNNANDYPQVTFDELLESCDIISVHCPLNNATTALLGYAEFCKMKNTAILVNVGRGGIVVESDLAKALNEGVIAGAALDVFEQEPIHVSNPLLSVLDSYRLILAPHSAWSAAEARDVLIATIAQNISKQSL